MCSVHIGNGDCYGDEGDDDEEELEFHVPNGNTVPKL